MKETRVNTSEEDLPVVRYKRRRGYVKPEPLKAEELHHPRHTPYQRPPKNILLRSIVIDGLGEEDED